MKEGSTKEERMVSWLGKMMNTGSAHWDTILCHGALNTVHAFFFFFN